MQETVPTEGTRFPPPFREAVEKSRSQAVDLTYDGVQIDGSSITVARQYRIRTGFALMPSYPKGRALRTNMDFKMIVQSETASVKDSALSFCCGLPGKPGRPPGRAQSHAQPAGYDCFKRDFLLFSICWVLPRKGGAVMA